jgi:magnesium chelatase family protein
VLFLDELGEFRRDALEALRQPLEEGEVTLSRLGRSVTLPARFILVAASNPCPCGRGADSGECDCHPTATARYRAKLSGALADRIDIRVTVDRPGPEELAEEPGEKSSAVRVRVAQARYRQAKRLGAGRCNAEMGPEELRRHCPLPPDAQDMLAQGHRQLDLSGRGWDRVLRVSRTIADLKGSEGISEPDIAAALSLRRKPEV